LLVAREGPVVDAIEFDEARLRDVAGEIAAGANTNRTVTATVEHQGWRGNSAQEMPHISIAQRLEQTFESSWARRSPEQACPPGSRLRIVRQTRRECFDAGWPAPNRYELLQPLFILIGP
jgi:hypothetical protein